MTSRNPSPEQLARYVDVIRGIERILLRKAPRFVRWSTGLTDAETLAIAILLADAHNAADLLAAR